MSFTKKNFSIELSRLLLFDKPKVYLEQYPTDSNVAADFLWSALMNGEIEGKTVIDIGAGTGILGFGAMLLGAKKVVFLEIDEKALDICKKNYENICNEFDVTGCEVDFVQKDISKFESKEKFDVVLQNPPFGIKKEHADKIFLETAFKLSKVVYSLHKSETLDFVDGVSKDAGFKVTHKFKYNFPLKSTMSYHTRKIKRIDVTCFRIEKKS